MTRAPRPTEGVSVCVINFEGADCLPRTLDAAGHGHGCVDELILVDSASSDRSREIVAARFPHVRVIALAENRGPATARNHGYAAARHDRVVFIDHDVVVEAECVARLLEALAEDDQAVVALPRVLFAAEPDVVQFEGADAHFLGLMALRLAGVRNSARNGATAPGRTTPVGSMVSACFALHKGRWGPEPPFDGSFRFNYEDHDFGVRCRARGFHIVAVPGASCLHGEGTPGLSLRDSRAYPRARVGHLVKGRWVILLKCFQLRTLIWLAPALLVYEACQLVLVIRRRWLREWIGASGEIVLELRSILEKRRAVQRVRQLPDRALLTGGPLPLRADFPSGRWERLGLGLLERFSTAYWRLVRRAL